MGSLVCFSYYPLNKNSIFYFVAASVLGHRKKMKTDAVKSTDGRFMSKGMTPFPQTKGRGVAIERFLGIGKET